MRFARNDYQMVALYLVNQSMFIVNTPGPVAAQLTLQRFGLTNSCKRVSRGFNDQAVKAFKEVRI